MTAAMAVAQTAPAGTQPGMRARMHQQFLQSLNLTPAQQQQAKAIRQSTRQEVQPMVQQLRHERQSLTAAIKAEDNAKIQQLSAAMGTLRGQVLAARSAGMAKFYALLTPDQKAKAAELGQQARQTMRSRGE